MNSSDRPPHHAFPLVRILSVMVIMAIVVSALWLLIRQFDDTNLPDIGTSSPVATSEGSPPGTPSTATPASSATPEDDAAPEWPVGSLPAMLDLAPDRLADDSLPLNDIARYADIAGWMAACGVATPSSLDDPALSAWEAELDNLAIPTSLRERGLDPIWSSTYGFDLTQVHQVLVVGQAPDYVTVMRGAFDPAALQNAWVTSGYQAVELEGHTIWSLFPGDTIDLSAQPSRPAMGSLNNVVLLEDGTLIAAAKMSRLESVLQVVDGNSPSLAENDDVAALLVPEIRVDRLASAVISKGTLLQANGAMMPGAMSTPTSASPAASPAAGEGMPEVELVLLGIPLANAKNQATPASESDDVPTMIIALVFGDVEDAQQADSVITSRVAGDRSPVTGDSYSARLARATTSLVEEDGPSLVMINGHLVNGPGDWLAILSDRDFGFAYWLPDD